MKLMLEKLLKNNTKLINTLYQFIKFSVVGMSNTIISLTVYYLFLGIGMNYILANTAGFIMSIFNAFYWNHKYVFPDNMEDNKYKAFLKIFMTYGGSFILSIAIIFIMVDCLNISQWIAPIVRLIITIPLNFLLNKLWVFKSK